MQKPIFSYQQDPFGILQNKLESNIPITIRYADSINANPIKKNNHLKGLFFALLSVVGIVLLYIYRETIAAFIIKLKESFKKKEIEELQKLEEISKIEK